MRLYCPICKKECKISMLEAIPAEGVVNPPDVENGPSLDDIPEGGGYSMNINCKDGHEFHIMMEDHQFEKLNKGRIQW
jgi:hypothetical protein